MQPQQPQQPQRPHNPAQNAGIIMLVCAGVLALGLFTKGWATATEGRETISGGLFGFEGCRGSGRCQSAGWDEAAKALDISSDVNMSRIVGMIAGFLALAGLVAVGAMCLGGNVGKIPVKPILITASVAAGTLTYFAIRFAMSDRDVNFGPSYSAFAAIGALVASGFVLRKMVQPLVDGAPAQPQQPQQPQAPPPQQQQQAAPCATCGAPLTYVQQYQRWYCNSCQKYV